MGGEGRLRGGGAEALGPGAQHVHIIIYYYIKIHNCIWLKGGRGACAAAARRRSVQVPGPWERTASESDCASAAGRARGGGGGGPEGFLSIEGERGGGKESSQEVVGGGDREWKGREEGRREER